MSLRLAIVHRTGFRYDGRVSASFNEARLTPQTTPNQTALEARLEVSPRASIWRYWDYWGSHVTAFDVNVPHDELLVTSRSLVEVHPEPTLDTPGYWADLREPRAIDENIEWLTQTRRTAIPQDLALALRDLADGLPPSPTARAVCAWLREQVDYVPGATSVNDSAADAWQARKGVCQDITHLAVGALRHLGIPARYVSGYLHPDHQPLVGATVRGESHAWVEWWAGGWHAWDPTNRSDVAERHVFVARGRDYADVVPLKGLYSGPAGSRLFVSVEVSRVR